jgi:hypothetical protein
MKRTLFDHSIKLGVVDNEDIYLKAPSWDCDWYWGFGYIGNRDHHYHLDWLNEGKNQNFYDAIKEHFGASFVIKDDNDIWLFSELIKTFYTLRETAKLLVQGHSNYCTNPLSENIKNIDEAKRINEELMPLLFNQIYRILKKYD